MFGKRGNEGFGKTGGTIAPPQPVAPSASSSPAVLVEPQREPARHQVPPPPMQTPQRKRPARTEEYYDTKAQVFSALIDTIDLSQLAKLDGESAREEIRDIVNDIITIKNFAMSISEQEELLDDICNDVLGYGPLEPLLARDDIADIMVNGSGRTFIEVGGKTIESEVRFRDNSQLLSICQRIVSQVGRRVDESSPICDARLPDGSRVNVIAPPLAIDGPALTIRKFKKDKLTLDQLVRFGAITPEGATLLQIIGRVRCNIVISGGTGSGKTISTGTSGSSPARIRPNCSCSSRMSCASKPVLRTSRAKARSPCAISSRTACACVRNGSSSAKCADRRSSICCRR
jgi:pilus assembly protein CpaF